MYKFVSFTIVELFEKVWKTPMVKLAHDIDISDVALAKACRKAGIPLSRRSAQLTLSEAMAFQYRFQCQRATPPSNRQWKSSFSRK
ncbi:hypothetical protein CRX42_00660 [Pseudomonas jessenii]|uniref:Uncharacterized protein n=1 Tax=Pseudomonas jessenii TaxID=77298 RepID=A0A2W0EVX1_PSEJE|nr:hypothetical protein CRX42_00660 [Pseudomonas jessenii]